MFLLLDYPPPAMFIVHNSLQGIALCSKSKQPYIDK